MVILYEAKKNAQCAAADGRHNTVRLVVRFATVNTKRAFYSSILPKSAQRRRKEREHGFIVEYIATLTPSLKMKGVVKRFVVELGKHRNCASISFF